MFCVDALIDASLRQYKALSSLEPSRRGSAVVQTIAIAMSVNVMDSRANREVALRSDSIEGSIREKTAGWQANDDEEIMVVVGQLIRRREALP